MRPTGRWARRMQFKLSVEAACKRALSGIRYWSRRSLTRRGFQEGFWTHQGRGSR